MGLIPVIIAIVAAVVVATVALVAALKGAEKEADTFSCNPVGESVDKCSPKDQVQVVELVEVVGKDDAESTQAPAARKQYINLDEKVDAGKSHPEYGRVIRFKARLEWVAGDKKRSLGNQKVYWYAKPGADNRGGLEDDESYGFSEPGKTRKESYTDEKGWTQPIEFHTSQYGGDKLEVFATQSPGYDGGKGSGEIETWRKMWYSVTEMKKQSGGGKYELPAGSLTKVVASFKKVFVEVVDSGQRNEGDFVDNFANSTESYEWADKYCDSKHTPWKINYAVVHHSARKQDQTIEVSSIATAKHTVKKADGTTLKFRPFDFSGTSWLKSAKYKKVSGGSWQNVPAGVVRLVGSNPRRRIELDFGGSGVDPTADAIKVKIKFRKAFVANGWGGTNLHLTICRGSFDEYYSAATRETAMAGTSIHEPGHSLGLVRDLDWETSDSAHSSHCEEKQCVMWWQGYTGRPLDFHPPSTGDPGCHTYVRGMNMSRKKMKKWKFPR